MSLPGYGDEATWPKGWGHVNDPRTETKDNDEKADLGESIEDIIKLATAARRACVCGNQNGAYELLHDVRGVINDVL